MSTLVRPIRPGISISQSGFGAALGGTLGCFVQDDESGKIMLLSNMHVLQFFQDAPQFFYFTQKPASQMEIVQPCTAYLKDMAELTVGKDKKAVYAKRAGKKPANYGTFTDPPPAPTEREVNEAYMEALNECLTALAKVCHVATFTRGILEANFDAAVATLETGTMWTNVTPDNTTILAPPPRVVPQPQVWKYGDASGAKKWGSAAINQVKVTVPFKTFNQQSGSFAPIEGQFKQNDVVFDGGNVWKITGNGQGTFQIQGDSGSALCDNQNRLVGLMSTGGIGNTAYAIPIDAVFEKLKVRFPAAPSGTA